MPERSRILVGPQDKRALGWLRDALQADADVISVRSMRRVRRQIRRAGIDLVVLDATSGDEEAQWPAEYPPRVLVAAGMTVPEGFSDRPDPDAGFFESLSLQEDPLCELLALPGVYGFAKPHSDAVRHVAAHVLRHAGTGAIRREIRAHVQNVSAEVLSTVERLIVLARWGEHGDHVQRVGYMTAALLREAGGSDDDVSRVAIAAQMHDVGKALVPPEIRHKDGKHTAAETLWMKRHTLLGLRLLEHVASQLNGLDDPLWIDAMDIASGDHEKWDGTGYPGPYTGDEAPLLARITKFADVFDAARSRRRYKEAKPVADVLLEMQQSIGKEFDPHLASFFLHEEMMERLERIRVLFPE